MDRFQRIPVILGTVAAACALTACAAAGQTVGRTAAVDGTACSSTDASPRGMAVITLAELPPAAIGTLKRIAAGGPYPYAEDGTVFGNYQRLLPREPADYYHEYTVAAAGVHSRGPSRVVTGAGGQDYYTPDHYLSFAWISCGTQTSR